MKVIKKHGKTVSAYRLGDRSEVLDKLIAEGKLIPRADGTYEVFSQESVNGSGQIAKPGDYIKLDSVGSPYPNDAEFFNANHRHIEGDSYEQIPKPLLAWTVDEPITEEISFLIAHKGLILNDKSPDKYFNAPLWGTVESSPRDSVLIFYSVSRNEAGEITDADFNFVARAEFDKNYNIIKETEEETLMKTVRVFIGSSIVDLEFERMALMSYIQTLNNKLHERGAFIEGYACEETSNAMCNGGSQMPHNEYIAHKCDIAIFMFYRKAGEFTLKELELARQAFIEKGKPNIYVFFKTENDTPVENDEIRRTLELVVNEYGHYYKLFDDVNDIKLQLLYCLKELLPELGD